MMCVTPSPESTTTPVVKPAQKISILTPHDHASLERTLRIERQHGLNSHIYALEPILLKHDLHHPLPIDLWVHRWFSEQHFPPARVDFEFLVKGVIPEMFHVFPVPDDTVFHRLGYLKVVAVLCSLVADHDVFDHCRTNTFFSTQDWTADDGGKDYRVRLIRMVSRHVND